MAKEINLKDFQGVRKSVMAAEFPDGTTQDEKEMVFQSIIRMLIEKAIVHPNGTTYKWRDGCLEYMLEVLPKLDGTEIMSIKNDKEGFYHRFCFCPSGKAKSLYSEIKRIGASQNGRFKNISIMDIFEDFTSETGLSPFELPEDREIVPLFLEKLDEVALFDLTIG